MAEFYTSNVEEMFIDRVRKEGFGYKNPDFSDNDFPKYLVLRVALARALRGDKIDLESPLWEQKQIKAEKMKKAGEYHLTQITGKGNKDKKEDFDIALRALFYVLHKDELRDDIFNNDELYIDILGKYIRRGLYEISNSWKNSDSIYQWGIDNLGFDEVILSKFQKFENSCEYFERLRKYYKEFGVSISLMNEFDSYRHHICKIEIDDVNCLSIFVAKAKFLDNEFGKSVFVESCEGVPRGFNIQIAKPQEQWRLVGKEEFQVGLAQLKRQNLKLGIYAGQSIDNKPFCFDLKEVPHLFVAGATGGGKSVFLKSLILCLLQNQNVEITVFDQKDGLDFKVFNPKIRLITDFEQIQLEVENLIEEMNERYKKMSEMSNDDIVALGFSYKVIIVDELKDLIDQESKQNKEISDNLGRLAQKARAAGIHLVLATQRPDGHSFKGTLRTNIIGRIAFKVPKEADSKIILDEKGAEKLLGSGDMLVKMANMSKPKHIFSPFLQPDDIQHLI